MRRPRLMLRLRVLLRLEGSAHSSPGGRANVARDFNPWLRVSYCIHPARRADAVRSTRFAPYRAERRKTKGKGEWPTIQRLTPPATIMRPAGRQAPRRRPHSTDESIPGRLLRATCIKLLRRARQLDFGPIRSPPTATSAKTWAACPTEEGRRERPGRPARRRPPSSRAFRWRPR